MESALRLNEDNNDSIDTVVNFASSRSAFKATRDMILNHHSTIRHISIIAEGIPERFTKKLMSLSAKYNVCILGPSTVGGICAGKFRIGNTGGMLDNISSSKLFRCGSVSFVSRSGGLSNELSNIISAQTDGVNEGMAIGGDRYPCTTFIDHLLRYQNEPTCKILVVLGEVGGTLEYEIIKCIKNGRITKPIIAWCTGTCADYFSYDVQFGHAGALAQSNMEKGLYLPKINRSFVDTYIVKAQCGNDFTVLLSKKGFLYGLGNILGKIALEIKGVSLLSVKNNIKDFECSNGFVVWITNENGIYSLKSNQSWWYGWNKKSD